MSAPAPFSATRLVRSPLFWILTFFVTTSVGANLVSGQSDNEGRSATNAAQSAGQIASHERMPGQLIREGTMLESETGVCRSSGERISIQLPGEEKPLIAIENLASQRIAKAIYDNPQDDLWVISGEVTEFQDRNYIILRRISRGNRSEYSR